MKIVAAAVLSRKFRKFQIPNSNIQSTTKFQYPTGVISFWDFVIGTSLELGILEFGAYVGDSVSAICRINSHALRKCSSVVSTLPKPIRMTVRPRNFVCVR